MDGPSIAFDQKLMTFDATDEEFWQSISWKHSVAAAIVQPAEAGNVQQANRKWLKTLRQRNRSTRKFHRGYSPALWSRFAFPPNDGTQHFDTLLERLGNLQHQGSQQKNAIGPNKKSRKRARAAVELDDVTALVSKIINAEPTSIVHPFELLALIEVLESIPIEVDADLLMSLFRTTLVSALQLLPFMDEAPDGEIPEDQRLLITGELPWRIGLLFGDIKGSRELRKRGQKELRTSLLDQTDSDGTPSAQLLKRLPLWLSTLVRSAEAGQKYDVKLWTNDCASRFESLVSIVAPMCRPDGRIALSNGSSYQVVPLLQAATRVAGLRKNTHPRQYLLGVEGTRTTKKSSTTRLSRRDFPVTQSDWAQLACLRSDWSTAANVLVVAHHERNPLIDLTASGRLLLSGPWEIDVSIDGQPLDFCDNWDCVCWHSDRDADYLELEQTFDDGLKVHRQLLLSRKDEYALLADCISNAGNVRIDYTSRLPLLENWEAQSTSEIRECTLADRAMAARVFPLALPYSRVTSTSGGFGLYSDQLVLKQVSASHGLYAPLVIDWNQDRRNGAVQWRSLTVTEDGRIISDGLAAGHRLRFEQHQLFVYRSLAEPEVPRAILGHHTLQETVIGRFNKKGVVVPILLVE